MRGFAQWVVFCCGAKHVDTWLWGQSKRTFAVGCLTARQRKQRARNRLLELSRFGWDVGICGVRASQC